MNNIFYTYQLIDSSAPFTPFYFGKGKGDRMNAHKKNALNGTCRNKYLQNKILKILREGNDVIAEKIIDNVSEVEAFAMEREVIKFYKDIEIRICNMTDGGDGVSGYIYSTEFITNRNKRQSEAWTTERRKERSITWTPERKKTESQNCKTKKMVERVSDGTVYASIKECADKNGHNTSAISNHCRGIYKKQKFKYHL